MKMAKYLFVLWTGIFVYVLLSVFWGPTGLSARHQLEREQERQQANIEHLRQINRELEDTMNSLLYDMDTLAIHAREQGYASQQERFIRIVGLGVNQKNLTSYGELVIAAEPHYVSDRIIRIIALCSAISIFICMVVFDILKHLKYYENRQPKGQES